MKTILRFCLVYFVLNLIACSSTHTIRGPAQSEQSQIYKYQPHFSCIQNTSPGQQNQNEWSALSGFKLRKGSYEAWLRFNKKVLRPFTSDGCSASLDGLPFASNDQKWTRCCVEHDIEYWVGGTKKDKEQADEALQKCMEQKGFSTISRAYKLAVQNFGGPDSSNSYRWGFGWNYRRSYSALTQDEESLIREEYGDVISQIKNNLKQQDFSLQRVCGSYDYGLNKISQEEEKIFRYLSESILNDDVIEWMKLDYYNSEKKDFLIKLQSCKNPMKISIASNRQEPMLQSDIKCENVTEK